MPFKSNKPTTYTLLGAVVCVVGVSSWIFFQPFKGAEKPEQPIAAVHSSDTESPAQPTLDDLLASASAERGRRQSHTCIECHTFDEDGPNRFGPNLFGIYGGPHAHKKDYVYSDALMAMRDKIWDADKLDKFLNTPKQYAPGTKMIYPGVPSAQDRADVIVFLKTLRNH